MRSPDPFSGSGDYRDSAALDVVTRAVLAWETATTKAIMEGKPLPGIPKSPHFSPEQFARAAAAGRVDVALFEGDDAALLNAVRHSVATELQSTVQDQIADEEDEASRHTLPTKPTGWNTLSAAQIEQISRAVEYEQIPDLIWDTAIDEDTRREVWSSLPRSIRAQVQTPAPLVESAGEE